MSNFRPLLFFCILLIIGCSKSDTSVNNASNGNGQGGSLARFTLIGDYLYTLETNQLNWYAIATNGKPEPKGNIPLSDGKETIFPLGNLLFIGATDGMSVFEIGSEGEPQLKANVQHFVSCDPVVANENYAYVTLRQEACNGFFNGGGNINVLNIYDLSDIENPNWIVQYEMIAPRGMGLASDVLFLCEGEFGLKVLDISDPFNVQEIAFHKDIHANDVIVLEEQLLVIGPDNITQFDYSDPTNLVMLSAIEID